MTLGASQISGIQPDDLTIETYEDWLTYEPISDTNLNSSLHKMVIDNDNNIHSFWCSENETANTETLYHKISYANSSTITTNIVGISGSFSNVYDLDVDSLNQIHLIIRNNTGDLINYYVVTDTTWELTSVVDVDINNYCVVVDSLNNVHLIYSAYDGNIYDSVYSNNNWQEIQVTDYQVDEGTEYFVSFFLEKTKSLQGKIAILYSFEISNLLPKVPSVGQIHCLIYKGGLWGDPKIISETLTYCYSIEFDDTEKLHLVWTNFEDTTNINYQTYRKNKWSVIKTPSLFESTETPYGYYSVFEMNLELQGTTILLAYTKAKFLNPVGFDFDLFIAQSTDGENWISEAVYTSNLTRSWKPFIESTTDGDVYVVAFEKDYTYVYNDTIYFGYAEDLFTYQTTTVGLESILFICAAPLIIFIYKKKTKK
ncbi:MAG: hypothetical protein FK733_17015 [Asgard group archaeon]|nr:hypothetical protein [Asgard group archaeon]